MQPEVSAFDAESMTRALLWLFFLADLAGIAWAVRVLVREARRHLSWHLGQRLARRSERQVETLELPDGFVVRPYLQLPQQRDAEHPVPARPATTAPPGLS